MKLKTILFTALSGILCFTSCQKNLTTFSLDTQSIALTSEGQTKDVNITAIMPSDAKTNFTWTSDHPEFATVAKTGDRTATITAVANGTAKITVASSGVSKEINVTVNIGGVSEGDGSQTSPYSVGQVVAQYQISGASTTVLATDVWVQGYIVGGVKNTLVQASPATITVPEDIVWGTTDVRPAAVVIADDPTCTDWERVVIVKLTAETGGTVPEGLSSDIALTNRPCNIGKTLKVKGNLSYYFGRLSVRPVTAFESNSEACPAPTGIFSETFATGQGNFSIVDVTMPSELTRVWAHDATYQQMKAGAYANSTNYATESWLVSPTINLSNVSAATFTFDHAGKQFGAPTTNLTIQISTNYTSGNVNTATWTELSIPNHLSGETNTFKSSGNIDLTTYCGQSNVHIAFKYTSTATGAGNWYVKNVLVK
ncbi:MAG: DUF5017 domain-containing protein [Bacteroidales bacterium]|jgi:hypothetical protein|nr:DUF5017 domain-containing protein [Bacteroidales bacterium]